MDKFSRQKDAKDHKIDPIGIEKFHEATKYVYTHYRFFYYILRSIKIQEVGDVWLAGVGYRKGDTMPTLFFNSESFNKYKYFKENDKGEKIEHVYEPTYEELTGVIVHELLHVCQNIFGRQSKLGMDMTIANIAHDILINREIPALSRRNPDVKTLADFVVHQDMMDAKGQLIYPSLKDMKLDDASLPMVYDAIDQDTKDKRGLGPVGLEQLKKMMENGELIVDYHGFDEGEGGNDLELTEEAQAYLDDLIKESAKKCDQDQTWGHLPGSLKRELDNLMKPKPKWRSTLEHFIQSCRLDTTQHTWKRHSRRYGNRASGRKADNAPNLLIGIDTSGSISEEDFQLFYSYMSFAATFCKSIKVAFCDTQIAYADELHDDQRSKFPKSAKGGGGTDMQPIFDYAKEQGVDGCVLLTDGCWGTDVNTYKVPTIALIPSKYNGEAPGIKCKISFE